MPGNQCTRAAASVLDCAQTRACPSNVQADGGRLCGRRRLHAAPDRRPAAPGRADMADPGLCYGQRHPSWGDDPRGARRGEQMQLGQQNAFPSFAMRKVRAMPGLPLFCRLGRAALGRLDFIILTAHLSLCLRLYLQCYPTSIRGFALGLCSSLARWGGFAAPFVVDSLHSQVRPAGPSLQAGSAPSCGAITACLPSGRVPPVS